MLSLEQVTNIAAVCHEANRMYCLTLGDISQPGWMEAPTWQRQSAINGVSALIAGRVGGPIESHESWSKEKLASGWKYGPVKDPEAKTHPCLVPYHDLPLAQQMKDQIFVAIVRAMANLK
jgi:hypothetical protein